ncbi:MAG TPA: VTT domain-containing protein [Casimicrobiaceae bacterium]|nr:VTT domain-containing protein [Casimicrobiaceae bacterium]
MEAILAELARHGVPLVGVNVLLQQLGLPIPAVPTMIVAGALAADGRLSGPGTFAIAVAASVLADALWFWAGRRYGYPVLRLLCRLSLSPDRCVQQTEGIFARWGFYSVIVSKFVPGFSTVAPPVAGALRMRVPRFVAAATASAALWVGAAMGAGALFRREVEVMLAWMSEHAALAAAVVLGLFLLYVAWKGAQRWRLARFVEARMIGVEELAAAMRGPAPPLVVDVGGRLAQESRPHLPGALMLDLTAIANGHEFPRDRLVVFYCQCPNEASAKRATQLLAARGQHNARPLAGGLDAWMAAGQPVEHPLVRLEEAA